LSSIIDDDEIPVRSQEAEAVFAKRDELIFLSKLNPKKQQLVYRKRLLETLDRAVGRSNYFRQRLATAQELAESGADIAEIIQSIPVTSREEIQRNYPAMRTPVRGARPKDYFDSTTSGSTGKAVRVWKYTPEVRLMMGAVDLLDFFWQKTYPSFIQESNQRIIAKMITTIDMLDTYIQLSGKRKFIWKSDDDPGHMGNL
jgi:hypothetical protein